MEMLSELASGTLDTLSYLIAHSGTSVDDDISSLASRLTIRRRRWNWLLGVASSIAPLSRSRQ